MTRTRRRPTPQLAARLGLAALGGAAVYASMPPLGWWWAAILGIAVLTVALAPWGTDRPRVRGGALVGGVFGFVFFGLLLPWVGLYVGAYAAWGLAAVEALYLVAFGALAVPILRAACAAGPRPISRGALGSAALATWWGVCEWVRSSWPWGGFPWGRLAFGQADGPLLPLAGLVGSGGLTLVVVLAGAALGIAALAVVHMVRPSRTVPPRENAPSPVGAAAILAGVLAAIVVAQVAPGALAGAPADRGTVRVALVQGNVPRLGLDFSAQRRVVLDNHVRETLALAGRVDAGTEPRPDLVIWPENASDVSPLHDAQAQALITDASGRVGAPILVGTVLPTGTGRDTSNAMLVWDGERGPVDRHDKRFVQPFGEWLPWRGLFEALFPIAKSAGHIQPGADSAPVTIAGIRTAVATCYEIAFDDAAREPIAAGAQLLAVPTNNATFGRSDMTYQQLGMSRVRAVEHHVPVLVAATSGVSAVIDTDGGVREQTAIFEPAVLTATVPLGGAGTMATRLGGTIDLVCRLLGLVGVAWGLLASRRLERDPVPAQEHA